MKYYYPFAFIFDVFKLLVTFFESDVKFVGGTTSSSIKNVKRLYKISYSKL